MLPTAALAAAATAWGMFIRARRQLLSTLRDRAQRAEADQLVRAESARLAERTRIAREMHDVLAHRISLVALHAGALEVALDLPPAQVRESAALLRLTAHQALGGAAGRDRCAAGGAGAGAGVDGAPTNVGRHPTPGGGDSPCPGAKVDFEMQVDDAASAPGPLGRDAYRIVQEALTNIGKHARGTHARVRVAGGAEPRMARQRLEPKRTGRPRPSGSAGFRHRPPWFAGAGDPANGVLVHGPDASGDFVVEADLPW